MRDEIIYYFSDSDAISFLIEHLDDNVLDQILSLDKPLRALSEMMFYKGELETLTTFISTVSYHYDRLKGWQ